MITDRKCRWLKRSAGRRRLNRLFALSIATAVFALSASVALAAPDPVISTGKLPEGGAWLTDLEMIPGGGPRPAGAVRDAKTGGTVVPGQYIVVLNDSVEQPGDIARAQTERHGGRLGLIYRYALKGYSAKLTVAAAQALRKNPNVKYVSPVHRYQATSQKLPAGVKRIGAGTNPALDIDEIDDFRVDADIAIIDSGVDISHPDLNVVSRANCVPTSEGESEWTIEHCIENAGTDGYGHGTHVAGTVGAIDNGFGAVGVAPGARLWAVRVLNKEGAGYDPWIIAGIDWVTAHSSQIEVANMSLGGWGRSQPMEDAVNGAVAAGVVVVVAAGNESVNALQQSPANVPAAITVSAMVDTDGVPGGYGKSCQGADDTLAEGVNWASNWGSAVDLAAPGACIYSTLPVGGSALGASSYGTLSGTSMATPHVAGAAAVLAAKSNPATKADVEAITRQLVSGGSLDWTDTSEDGAYESLVYGGGTPLSTPEATTGGWDSTGIGSVKLSGSLNTRGQQSTYAFEIGPTSGYGTTVSASSQRVEGSYMRVAANAGGLDPGRTYHYRLVLTTVQGTFYGSDRTLSPSRWSSRIVTNGPAAEDEQLSAVSCPTDGWCMGVDWEYVAEGKLQPGSYVFKGGQWTFVAMPMPAEASSSTLRGVSCTSQSNCIAVGRVSLPGPKVTFLVEKWNGASWSIQSVPAPPTEASQPYARLDDVSCASSSECMAVGYFKVSEAGGNVWREVVARLQGGTWTNMYPIPADPANEPLGVSCPSANFCAVTGVGPSLIWNGTSWSPQPQASPEMRFEDVSCTSQNFCLAVTGQATIGVWNGTSWSAMEHPAADLWGVDCTSPSRCLTAGRRYGITGIFPVVERWNGTTLSPQATLHESERRLTFWDIDCSPGAQCAAVGGGEGEVRLPLVAVSSGPTEALETPQVGPDKANLRGTVNPNGFATSYRFEWGPTTSYGNLAPVPDQALGSGGTPVRVNQLITGLKPSTTYHYRVVAESEEGKTATADATFTTSSLSPTFSKAVGSFGSEKGQFNEPFGVAVSPVDGTIAVADAVNNRIQIFDEEGNFLRQFGSSGPAPGQFKEPNGVAFDQQGDIWVADTYNNRVQELSATGQPIRSFGTEGTANGAFMKPSALAIDAGGTVWVADTFNKRVQAFSATGTYISKFSTADYNFGIAVDASGDIWSSTSEKIRENSSAGTLLRSFGSSGSGNGQLWNARGLAIDRNGNVWVADGFNNRVQIFSATGEYLTKFGASGSGSGQFAFPIGIALDPRGNAWIVDRSNSRLQRWKAFSQWPPTFSKAVGSFGSEKGQFNEPFGVAVSPVDGTIAVADAVNNRIQIFDEEGNFLRQFGSSGPAPGQFKEPNGVAFDQQGDIWVADTYNNRVQELSATGQPIRSFGTEGTANGAFMKPSALAIDAGGTVWVADTFNKRVQAFSATGTYISKFSTADYNFGIAVDASGDIWSSTSEKIRENSSAGTLLRSFGSSGSGNGQLWNARGLAIDRNGNVWVADGFNNRVQIFSATGEYLTKFGASGSGSGQFAFPIGIALDPRGNAWIVDRSNSRLQRWAFWP